MTRWDKDHRTDLEELTSRASILILFGGLAVGVIIGLVVLAFVLSEPSGVFVMVALRMANASSHRDIVAIGVSAGGLPQIRMLLETSTRRV